MSRPTSGPERLFPAVCAHTHLFPGGRLRIQELPDPEGFVSAPLPLGLGLGFADGVVTDAELLVDDAGSAVLDVSAHTTRAGTHTAERVWLVRGFTQEGDEVEVTVGNRTGPNTRPPD